MNIALILTIIGLLIGLPPFIQYIRSFDLDSYRFNKLPIETKILKYIWEFPNKYHQTWAIKESQVLLGNLLNARDNPGLGWTFITFKFINKYCKENGKQKMLNAINFIVEKTQNVEPYFYLYETTNKITTRIEKRPDFRHSIAFGISLSLIDEEINHKKIYIQSYFDYLINNQEIDGGWQAGDGITASELFSTVYAIYFLHLNKNNFESINEYQQTINKALNWLLNNKNDDDLWNSGVFSQHYWDYPTTTPWVYLLIFDVIKNNEYWKDMYNNSSMSILNLLNKIDWDKKNRYERFRVEARIIAFLHLGMDNDIFNEINKVKIEAFINNWRIRSQKITKKIGIDELDLGTAILIAEPLIGASKINTISSKICK